MIKVSVIETRPEEITSAIESVFAPFGGVKAMIPPEIDLFIKPNAVSFTPHTFTDPLVLSALLAYLRDHGYTRLSVMENVTAGNFSRLVYHVTGYNKICRRYGAKPIYLDEEPVRIVTLREEDEPTRIPRLLYERFVEHRNDNFYLSLPKLKTHSMTTVTLGVKNQQAFPIHADRMHRHNQQTLHRRLASLFDLIRPDFCLVEGLTAVFHGHFPATALVDQCIARLNLLIGGTDTLAVDVVGARILGYSLDEIEHLRLCAQWNLGVGDLQKIEVVGESLDRFEKRYPHTLLGRFHPDVEIIAGKEKACLEGCRSNSLCIQEMLANDFGGKGGWTLVFGKGIDKAAVQNSAGPVLVIGPCATAELAEWLRDNQPQRNAYFVPTCNDLMQNTTYQAKLMGISTLRMSPVNPLKSAWLLLRAKINQTTARVPPIFG